MKLGIIGAGKMATALCRGFIAAGLVKPGSVLASDVNKNKLTDMQDLGVKTTTCNREVVQKKDVIYLAVKPYIVAEVLDYVQAHSSTSQLFVSVAAGITTKTMEEHLPAESRVIRVMPNIPVLVQSGASVFTCGRYATRKDAALVREMFGSVGLVEEMPEENMDAVTGLSGNGPAYGYLLINSLADGGVKMGLNRDQSIRLSAQAMLGAAKMILETGVHPEQLKDEVCSPGGTSAHAIHQMEKAGFRGGLVDAVEAGTLRSREIGVKYNS